MKKKNGGRKGGRRILIERYIRFELEKKKRKRKSRNALLPGRY